MKPKFVRLMMVVLTVGAALAAVFAVAASNLSEKGYAEGEGASGVGTAVQGTAVQGSTTKGYSEGNGYTAVGSRIGELSSDHSAEEGKAGSTGHATFPNGDAWMQLAPSADMTEVFRFSGVSDDGEQGSSNRKKATSIHCTNLSATDNQVEVRVIQWNGTGVFTGTLTMPPNVSSTFSTQNTQIYYDDVFIGGSTPAIFQGSGVVLAESPQIICSAQVLDPLGYPPVFAVSLEMYKR
ncbi:MAG: hypothetical protein H6665_15495 [Ardenticatenaceae bacterium]|nr:hypothetical protein [Ardenticatenaceae bacterium]